MDFFPLFFSKSSVWNTILKSRVIPTYPLHWELGEASTERGLGSLLPLRAGGAVQGPELGLGVCVCTEVCTRVHVPVGV